MSWEELVERWPRSRGQALDLLRRESIPVRARATAWLRMSGAEALMAEGGTSYEALLQQETRHAEAIRKDIHRTFAVFHEIPGFGDIPEALVRGFRRTGSQKAAALGRVLQCDAPPPHPAPVRRLTRPTTSAYAVYDPEVGYHQGLNFVAGVVLLQVGEEANAFWTLAALLSGGLRALFQARQPTLKAEIERFELVLQQTLPELAAHFREQGFAPILFAVDWFSTFFTYSLPCTAALWVFDLIMAGMPDPLFRVGAALLHVLDPTLRRLDFATLMHDFKSLSRSIDSQDLRSAIWHLASRWPQGGLPMSQPPQSGPVPPSPPLFYPSASPATSLALAVSEGGWRPGIALPRSPPSSRRALPSVRRRPSHPLHPPHVPRIPAPCDGPASAPCLPGGQPGRCPRPPLPRVRPRGLAHGLRLAGRWRRGARRLASVGKSAARRLHAAGGRGDGGRGRPPRVAATRHPSPQRGPHSAAGGGAAESPNRGAPPPPLRRLPQRGEAAVGDGGRRQHQPPPPGASHSCGGGLTRCRRCRSGRPRVRAMRALVRVACAAAEVSPPPRAGPRGGATTRAHRHFAARRRLPLPAVRTGLCSWGTSLAPPESPGRRRAGVAPHPGASRPDRLLGNGQWGAFPCVSASGRRLAAQRAGGAPRRDGRR